MCIYLGTPCDADGYDLPPGAPPAPHRKADRLDWTPYDDRIEFETAEFLFQRSQMPGTEIDVLLELWAASLVRHNDTPGFSGHTDLYATIDATTLGDAPWKSFSAAYTGDLPEQNVPPWKLASYEVWYRDPRTILRSMLANPDFKGETHYSPIQEFGPNGERRWKDLMSGNWCWEQAVCLSLIFRLILCSHSSFSG